MKKNFTKHILAIVFAIGLSVISYAQLLPPTNTTGNKIPPCHTCQPANWFNFGGTPDMSNRNQAAASGTLNGGTPWTHAPLPLPPNGHVHWITIRDVGPNFTEESVGTNITGLVAGREYEVVAYTLSSVGLYSPTYIDQFDFQVGSYPRVSVTSVNRDTDGVWGISRLRFTADATTMQLAFYPGNGSAGTNYESVNIAVTINAVNTIPVVEEKNTTTAVNVPTTIDVLTNAIDYDPGQSVVVGSIDLDPSTPGIQDSINTAEGTWVVNHTTGIVTFTPALDFTGIATIQYTIQDNYTLDNQLHPGTSAPQNISVIVACTSEVEGVEFFTSLDPDNSSFYRYDFNAPAADFGFQFDIYTLDNSFNLEINGVNIAANEIQFQSDNNTLPQNIRFADGTIYGGDTAPNIWSLSGNPTAPIVRVVISPTGSISLYGSKTSGGPLFPLELFNSNTFNTITWNTNTENIVKATQYVIGETHMTGYGSGLNVAPCHCTKPGASGTALTTDIGILTKSTDPSITGWPENVPNGYIALDSAEKGFVITHKTTAQIEALTPVLGMLAYDTDANCVKLYSDLGWKCIERTCNE